MVKSDKTDMQPVGAHYGWREWLAQRVTAVIMAIFAVVIFAYFMLKSNVTYADWKDLFSGQLFRNLPPHPARADYRPTTPCRK